MIILISSLLVARPSFVPPSFGSRGSGGGWWLRAWVGWVRALAPGPAPSPWVWVGWGSCGSRLGPSVVSSRLHQPRVNYYQKFKIKQTSQPVPLSHRSRRMCVLICHPPSKTNIYIYREREIYIYIILFIWIYIYIYIYICVCVCVCIYIYIYIYIYI